MQLRRPTRKLTLLIGIVLLVGIGGLVWQFSHPSQHTTSAECTVKPLSAVVSFFYNEPTSQEQATTLARSLHGRLTDSYVATNGYSMTISSQRVGEAVRRLQANPRISRVQTSPAFGCMDLD